MALRNNNHGNFFNPVKRLGYVFIACGLIGMAYSLAAVLLTIPGAFMAFTYTGTIIDTEKKRINPYTSHFGFIRTGKWIEVTRFARFKIVKSNRGSSFYSRGGVRFDMNLTDITLLLVSHDGREKVVVNRYSSFEEAQREKDELIEILFPITLPSATIL
jgi:hypothetical protein